MRHCKWCCTPPGGARSLARLGQLLQQAGPVVIPDLNGYGRTSINSEHAIALSAVEQHMAIVSALIDKLRLPRQSVLLIGHSMGGFLCLKIAMEECFPIRAMAIIEPVAFSVLHAVEDADARAEDLNKVMALDAVLKTKGKPEHALAEFIAYWGQTNWAALPASMRKALVSPADQIGAEALSVAQDTTATDYYQTLNMPVLLMQGADTLRPAEAVVRRLADLLPQAEVKTLKDVGHMGVAQKPDDFAVLINSFLTSRIEAGAHKTNLYLSEKMSLKTARIPLFFCEWISAFSSGKGTQEKGTARGMTVVINHVNSGVEYQ